MKNAEELIEEFEQRGIKVRRQEGEVEEYKRMELPGKYTAKLLYGWDDQKFKEEYLNKLEKIGRSGREIDRLMKASIWRG